eukprot:1920791-Pyramimonas_sp.AAC.1
MTPGAAVVAGSRVFAISCSSHSITRCQQGLRAARLYAWSCYAMLHPNCTMRDAKRRQETSIAGLKRRWVPMRLFMALPR